jgi:hypothetical protein
MKNLFQKYDSEEKTHFKSYLFLFWPSTVGYSDFEKMESTDLKMDEKLILSLVAYFKAKLAQNRLKKKSSFLNILDIVPCRLRKHFLPNFFWCICVRKVIIK